MKLQGKTAVVTGAGSGFGEAIAKLLAANGARVVVNDINQDGGQRVAREIEAAGGAAIYVHADVSKDADVANLAKETTRHFGGIEIFVNNAGITHRPGPLEEVDEALFDRIYAVNVKSIYLAARHVVPLYRKAGGGVFLNIASTAGVRPRPGLTWYNGTKGAMITLTRSMAGELAPHNIRVNAINPVAGDTPLLAEFMGGRDTPEARSRFIATIPMGRLSTPADIANAALFLVSDDAAFITGVCIEVDGGRCI